MTLVARNEEAFSFIYHENIIRLGEVKFFDPEIDVPTFEGVDLLYLPGGYPEKHLTQLSQACDARNAIAQYAARGGRVIAECGGMMYLCRAIISDGEKEGESIEYPMCGVLPYSVSSRKADRKLSLGYRRFMVGNTEYRGHEFHYTQFVGETPTSAFQVYKALGEPVSTPIIRQGNVIASYTHIYWGETGIKPFFDNLLQQN